MLAGLRMSTEVIWKLLRLHLSSCFFVALEGLSRPENWHLLQLICFLLLDHLQTRNLLSPSKFKWLIGWNWFGMHRFPEAILKHCNAASFSVVVISFLRWIVDFFITVTKGNVFLAVWDASLLEDIIPDRSIAGNSGHWIILYLLESLFLIYKHSLTFHIFF